MKRILLVVLFMTSLISFSQTTTSKCIIRAKDGAPFFLYVNGNLQNKVARSSVMIKDVGEDATIRIEFENVKLGAFQKHVEFDEDNQLFVIEKNKGKYRLQEADWDDNADVDFSMSASADGFNMKIKDGSAHTAEASVNYSSYESNTSSSSSASTSSSNYRHNGYNCSGPSLSGKDFKEFEAAVKESYMDYSRTAYIYKNIDKYCWQADQIAVLIKLLYSDEEQFKLAKYAHNLTYDTDNYDKVVDVLSSAKKRIELREWLQNLGRPAPTPNHPRPNPNPVPDTRSCRKSHLTDSEFADALRSIEKIPFEDSKMSQVESITQNTCLSLEQVRKLIRAFKFENNKLDLAKKLYAKTHNQRTYYLVNDELTFPSSKDELNEYIKNQAK